MSKRISLSALLCATSLACTAWHSAVAAPSPEIIKQTARGVSVTPASNFAPEGFAHTNVHMLFKDLAHRQSSSPIVGFETPASIACVYGFVAPTTGCNPKTAKTVPTGGSKVVVIVDAYDYPTAQNDLTVFSKQYGLPAITSSNFQVVYASGSKPPQDSSGGWEFEEALDIEMAHAMAPNAKVILVEGNSNSFADLFGANKVASKLASAAGGGEVSNSWSGGESSNEEQDESYFTGQNVVFLASTGDSPGVGNPSILQNVIGVGGTNIVRSSQYDYQNEVVWNNTGGGISRYVPIPSYQSMVKKVKKILGSKRGVPDISMNGGPDSPVSIYDTTPYQGSALNWSGAYGTSESSPLLAGVLNAAGSFAASTSDELTTAYGGYTNKSNWRDIISGSCGNNGGSKGKKGYDLCSGIGVPVGYGGK